MKSFLLAKVNRRDVFRAAAAGAAIAASGTASPRSPQLSQPAAPKKRRARYQANAPEVQNFYRVNRYPARQEM